MTERYPDDSVLLSLSSDEATGVEYIPTGLSPYHLAFRKFVQRTLLASERANDLRVYQDGDLSVGVRAGRCLIGGNVREFAGTDGVTVDSSSDTWLWLDASGTLHSSTTALPTDRTTFVPLATVSTGGSAITSITDLRAEALLLIPDTNTLGISVTAQRINEILDGTNATVDASALNTLTGGSASTADSEHRHLQVYQDVDDEVHYTLINDSDGSSANAALALSLPNRLASTSVLLIDPGNGFLCQRYDGEQYHLVGTVHSEYLHGGNLTASETNQLVGAVPITGQVSDVVLSVGTNMVSTVSTDGVRATVKVNGTVLTTTDPRITAAEGSGMKSTAQDDGTAAVVKSDGTEDVSCGDVLSVNLTRTAAGTVSTEAADIVVMVVIRASQPE